jgi:hypothetical protein
MRHALPFGPKPCDDELFRDDGWREGREESILPSSIHPPPSAPPPDCQMSIGKRRKQAEMGLNENEE